MSNVNNRYIEEELKQSYLDYSMSVIVSRALPDVRDGLKPVHRRILFAMNEMGMTSDKAYKKSARIVGEVLGKYHPHGDSAVYNTMVRMAQSFAYRYELVDGHGNFGSIDGDSAAAMRYTEARMSKISNELLEDIDKDTIDFRKNFDDSLDEPIVLPAKLPNLLLNGATGIAVGMATNIPPHNLGEVIDGILALIENRDITPVELMQHIKGPDFPTGGIIDGEAGIYDAYTTGRGRVRVRGKVEIEETKAGRQSIIINEIPYQLNKSSLIEKIANLVKEKRIVGISDLRDESDRDGIRVVIELKKGEEPELVLNSLYKYTELQTTFGIIMLALVNNIPRVLNLREVLNEYLKHRFEVVTRRTKYNLAKAERRAHLLKGFIIALENIDRVIQIVRGSSDGAEARVALIDKYGFSEEQSKAILDMKLQRLTGLERDKIDKEHAELKALIIGFNSILLDEAKVYEIIKDELKEIKEKYDDPRRTKIEKERLEIRPEDLIKDDSVLVTVTNKGYVKRMELDKYKAQKRGGKGVSTQNTIEDDFVERMEVMSNLDTMMIFTDKGRVFHLKVYQIPESSKQARGRLIGNLIKLGEDEKVREIIKIREFSQDKELVFVTRDGMVKKTNLSGYKNINTAGLKAIKLRDGDDIIFVGILPVESTEQIFLATKLGQSIRFSKDDVRVTGRDTSGVKGISLKRNDKVISALLIDDTSNETILTITENGHGKRTRVDEYPLQSRSGKGVINIRCSDKNGDVVAVKPVKDEDQLMVITSSGIVIRTPVNQVSIIGRATQGVKIMRVNESESEKVVSIASFKEEDAEIEETIQE
ncbi:MAG: DNA gyrase subunit A [Cetobacterium sp.]|uniref:DNA gyrase subunit A n=1 Tax=Cetobacterium sp. TaxID=2071632 RepID=UPI003F3A3983